MVGGTTGMTGSTAMTGTTTLSGGNKHVEGQYLVVLKHESGGGVGVGSGVGAGSGVGIGGGSSKWLIVQHASTAKP